MSEHQPKSKVIIIRIHDFEQEANVTITLNPDEIRMVRRGELENRLEEAFAGVIKEFLFRVNLGSID